MVPSQVQPDAHQRTSAFRQAYGESDVSRLAERHPRVRERDLARGFTTADFGQKASQSQTPGQIGTAFLGRLVLPEMLELMAIELGRDDGVVATAKSKRIPRAEEKSEQMLERIR